MNDGARPTGPDPLLGDVEDELARIDELHSGDQVEVYERLHTSLADALARTADTGGPPGQGQPGA